MLPVWGSLQTSGCLIKQCTSNNSRYF